ncbi:ribosomal RNA small subunit methyltransferase A [Patescibacteria group bacterium]|nr:ribosomal RNA small subunit methyltransferase A [Patescibacteria group bacterium]
MSYKKISSQTSKNDDIRPNKLLGQNWLRDKNVLKKIIAAANLTKSDTVLEVGPGEGILTQALAQSAGRVVAVEKDPALTAQLKIKFTNSKNVEIIEDDILSFLRKQESRAWIPGQTRDDKSFFLIKYKVVANIPYYLTSHLIRLLLESNNPPQDIILMIQKEVAQRICACPPKMSLLAVSVQFYAQPKIIASVSKNSFWPKPKVDSAIIQITPHSISHPERSEGSLIDSSPEFIPHSDAGAQNDKINNERFFSVLRAGFSHPRKQLLNNLSAGLKIPRDKINETLRAAGLKPNQRAETLSVADWIKITDLFFN